MKYNITWGVDMYDDPNDVRDFHDIMLERHRDLTALVEQVGGVRSIVSFNQIDKAWPSGINTVEVSAPTDFVARLATLTHFACKDDIIVYIPATVDLGFHVELASKIVDILDDFAKTPPFTFYEILVESTKDNGIKRSVLVFRSGDVGPLCSPEFFGGKWFRSAFMGSCETTAPRFRRIDAEALRRLSGGVTSVSRAALGSNIGAFLDRVSDRRWCAEAGLLVAVSRKFFIVAPSYYRSGDALLYHDILTPALEKGVKVMRPWGEYEVIKTGGSHLTKKITIEAGGSISKQFHLSRSERWVLVQGEVDVEVNNVITRLVNRGDAIEIKPGDVHFVKNALQRSKSILIEVQEGLPFVSEEDIVRIPRNPCCY